MPRMLVALLPLILWAVPSRHDGAASRRDDAAARRDDGTASRQDDGPASGQQHAPVTAGIRSYLRASSVLDTGIDAIGGLEALQATSSVLRRMSGDWIGSGQHPRPHAAPAPTLIVPPSNGRTRTVAFIDYSTGRFREEAFESDLTGDSITRVNAVTPVATIVGRKRLGGGSHAVELVDLGPTGHVTQLLAAYFPRDRVLYQADLWDPISLELDIAGPDAVALADRIRELGLEVERIVPVHGVPTTMAALERGLAVRARYTR